jgi:signal transduction histidine kinase
MLRGYTTRLAALYTAIFAVSVIVLGVVTLLAARTALQAQFEDRIRAESRAMVQEYATEGLEGIIAAVHERDLMPGQLDYGLDGPGGVHAGKLAGGKTGLGWSVLRMPPRQGEPEEVKLFSTQLPDGYLLKVGDDLDRTETLDRVVIEGFAGALLGIVVLGALGGYGLSRGIRRRLAAITGTAEAIIDGDLTRRVAVQGAHDDLDGLALTFNRMLDRIALLMDSVRQVSSDVAHDLRTPLTRLRNKLESGLTDPAGPRAEVLEGALADLDAILTTFSALLRIAQIDAGARRAAFREVDLTIIARDVVEAFAPSAEEGGRKLMADIAGPALVEGDAELLTQMLVNLVENGLHHTLPGSVIRVTAGGAPEPWLAVIDNGPGVPQAERERVQNRFYRLEQSRSTRGAGLGLALAAAVARLHQTSLQLSDNGPGLKVLVPFRPAGPKVSVL